MIRSLVLVLLAALLAGCQAALLGAVNLSHSHQGAVTPASVDYATELGLALDVYTPASAACPCPTVIFFYGGSWRGGSRVGYRFVAEALAEVGVVTAIPDYRTAPQVTFPAFMDDAARAVAWTRAEIGRFGGDPDRIFLMGHSAGAHIAVLLASDGRYLRAYGIEPNSLAGVIGLAGPYDFLPIRSRRIAEVFPGAEAEHDSQPVNFASPQAPPMLLLHGEADDTVWLRNSQRMTAALHAEGAEAELISYPEVGHVGILLGFWSRRETPPVLADSLRFIRARSR